MSVLLAFSVFGVVVQGVTNRDIKQAPEENTTLPLIESQKTEVKKPKVSRERQFEPLSKLNKDHLYVCLIGVLMDLYERRARKMRVLTRVDWFNRNATAVIRVIKQKGSRYIY
jgi:hypothetical protein